MSLAYYDCSCCASTVTVSCCSPPDTPGCAFNLCNVFPSTLHATFAPGPWTDGNFDYTCDCLQGQTIALNVATPATIFCSAPSGCPTWIGFSTDCSGGIDSPPRIYMVRIWACQCFGSGGWNPTDCPGENGWKWNLGLFCNSTTYDAEPDYTGVCPAFNRASTYSPLYFDYASLEAPSFLGGSTGPPNGCCSYNTFILQAASNPGVDPIVSITA